MFRNRSAWLTGAVVAALPGLFAAFGQSIVLGTSPLVGYVLAGATMAGLVWLVTACWASIDVVSNTSRVVASILVAAILLAWLMATAFRDSPVQVEEGRAVFLGGSSSITYLPVTIAAVVTLLVAGIGGRDPHEGANEPTRAGFSPVRAISAVSLLALAFAVATFFGPATAYVLPMAFFPVTLGWAAFAVVGVAPSSQRKRTWWVIAVVLALGWAALLANLYTVNQHLISLAAVSWQAAGLLGSTVGLGLMAPLSVGALFVHQRRSGVSTSGKSARS